MNRAEKLQKAQREHKALDLEIKELIASIKPIENKIRKLNSRRHQLGMAIYDLKHDGDTPEITDHAIVRYLERVEGLDINDIKLKVAQSKQAVKIGNVFVTVNPQHNKELEQ